MQVLLLGKYELVSSKNQFIVVTRGGGQTFQNFVDIIFISPFEEPFSSSHPKAVIFIGLIFL